MIDWTTIAFIAFLALPAMCWWGGMLCLFCDLFRIALIWAFKGAAALLERMG